MRRRGALEGARSAHGALSASNAAGGPPPLVAAAAAADGGPRGEDRAVYHVTEKRRWSFKNHFMTGLTLAPFCRLLRRYWTHVDWARYWQRAAFLGAMSVFNTLLGSVDWLLYRRDMAAQALHPEPIFILGHPRTGTTHVHNLMALDPRFACARTLHAGFPSAFLWLERFQWALAGLIDDTRPMDMMPLSFATPAEDEIATSALTGDVSAYLPLLFMRDHKQLFSDFYTFEGATAEDSRRWRDALLWFLRKVTLRCSWDDAAAAQHGGSRGSSAGRAGSAGAPPPAPRPLLIKSPVHTARVRTLLQLFPRARFIYVHRDPLEVFASAAHMADTYYWYCYLQTPGDADVTDFILDQYELLHRTYTADRALILPGRLVKVSFAELDGSPLGTLRRIYSGLGLEGFEAVRPACEAYCRGLHLKGFKKNAHRPLSPDLRRRVARRWGLLAAEFGYRISAGEGDAAADAVAARGEAAAV